jgi:large subunit ribosomal protein LP0
MPLSKQKKTQFHAKMTGILKSYEKVFIVDVTNVGSKQMNDTRAAMRGVAEMLMGKNTMMKKVLKDFMEANPGHIWQALEEKLSGKWLHLHQRRARQGA